MIKAIDNKINWFVKLWGEYSYNKIITYYNKNIYSPPSVKLPLGIKFKSKIIDVILKHCDPVVHVYFGRTKLQMRLSQKSPLFHAQFPIYKPVQKIAQSIYEHEGKLNMIDVGANIGDTAALISQSIPGAYLLCIEGEAEFVEFLRENTKNISNISVNIVPKFLTDTIENKNFVVDKAHGTANLKKVDRETVSNMDTLDNVLEKYPEFFDTNFLKICADGFEISILKSADRVLGKKPLLYMQYQPVLYARNDCSPFDIIDIFYRHGYRKVVVYSNFGYPLGLIDAQEKCAWENMVNKIDNKTIFYYHLLAVPDEKVQTYTALIHEESQ